MTTSSRLDGPQWRCPDEPGAQNSVARSARRDAQGCFNRLHRCNEMIRPECTDANADLAAKGRPALDENGKIIDGSSHEAHLLRAQSKEDPVRRRTKFLIWNSPLRHAS